MTSKKKALHVISGAMWFSKEKLLMSIRAPLFSNQRLLGDIFAQIFRDFSRVLRDFARSLEDLARMLWDFACIVSKPKLLGECLQPCVLHLWVHIQYVTWCTCCFCDFFECLAVYVRYNIWIRHVSVAERWMVCKCRRCSEHLPQVRIERCVWRRRRRWTVGKSSLPNR